MKKFWILSLLALSFVIYSCEDENGDPQGTTNGNVIDSNIETATTLTADKTWIIRGSIDVMADLVIEAGTVVKFEEDAALVIGYSEFGSLKAVGTADKPILFTSAASNPSKGDYDGIQFYEHNSESVSELQFCTIEYAGNQYYAAINLDNTAIRMMHCTITKSAGNGIDVFNNASFKQFSFNSITDVNEHAIEIEAAAVHTIDGSNTYQLAANMGIFVRSGQISANVNWKKQPVAYILDEYMIIEGNGNSASLTIDAGSELRFGANGYIECGYSDQGQVVVNGTTEDPVIMTSNASSPSAGDWQGIIFYSNTINGSILNNCLISYAGSDVYYNAAIAVDDCGSNVTVSNCTISHSDSNGIYVYISSPTLTNNIYENIAGENVVLDN